MARERARGASRDEQWAGSSERRSVTVGDLCLAIEERRIPVNCQRDDFVLTRRDLRRWLEGRGSTARSVS